MSNGQSRLDAEVLIAGGGLVGQTLVLALDQAGLSVLVADASKPSETLAPSFDGRAFAIEVEPNDRLLGRNRPRTPRVLKGRLVDKPGSWVRLAADSHSLRGTSR